MVSRQLEGDVPPLHGMTLFTGPHPAPMDVGMAVAATGSRVREHWFRVALRACHVLVHSAQGEVGLVVIEFRNRADRLPSHRGMAVLAGDIKVAVRTTRDGLGPSLCETERSRPAKQRANRGHRKTHLRW